MGDPANVTLTPALEGLKASALGVPSGSAFPDGEYCVMYMLVDEYERKGQVCYTMGAGGSLQGIIDQTESAIAAATNAIIAGVAGGAALLLMLIVVGVCYCRKKGKCCFKTKNGGGGSV